MVTGVEQGARGVQVVPKPRKPRPRAADQEARRVQVAPRHRKPRILRRKHRRQAVDPEANNVQLHGKQSEMEDMPDQQTNNHQSFQKALSQAGDPGIEPGSAPCFAESCCALRKKYLQYRHGKKTL